MVSFQCDGCADTVKKPKLDQHRQRCWASFTCLDCSKTFQNQEYNHTSCISEAEKYQGALYKGPRKGQQNQHHQQPPKSAPIPAPVADMSASTPVDSAASSPAPPAIHPSRLRQVDTASSGYQPPSYSRGGRGGSFGGRGGFGNAPPAPRGSKRNPLVSGENKAIPSSGMRSWGSPVVTESETAPTTDYGVGASSSSAASASVNAYVNGAGEGEKKKRKKKGDKGGTGSKANSKRPKEEDKEGAVPVDVATVDGVDGEPSAKKRKRSTSPVEVAPALPAEISDKTLKRLRKNATKVAEKSQSLSLGDWLKQVGDAKKEQVDVGDVNRAAKVSWENGKWVLTF